MRNHSRILALAVGAALLALPLSATLVLQMDLEDLCSRADRIFRGTVVEVTPGTIAAGGTQLPVVTYRLRVDESFKGEYLTKGDERYVEITMLGSAKAAPAGGTVQHLGALPQVPQLKKGHDYVLFTTAPSAIGLSSPVGLGQGCFGFQHQAKEEMVLNENSNLGLYGGPVSYTDFAADIRAAVAGQ